MGARKVRPISLSCKIVNYFIGSPAYGKWPPAAPYPGLRAVIL